MSIISVLSQKGGLGKTALSRTIAREFSNAGLDVLIADMDTKQKTASKWVARRIEYGIEPFISGHPFKTVEQAMRNADKYNMIVFDGTPSSSTLTVDMAKVSDLCVLPMDTNFDGAEPQIILANDLVNAGIDRKKIVFAYFNIYDSDSEIEASKTYLESIPNGFKILDGAVYGQKAYKTTTNEGKALTETKYKSLNDMAEKLVQSISDELDKLTK